MDIYKQMTDILDATEKQLYDFFDGEWEFINGTRDNLTEKHEAFIEAGNTAVEDVLGENLTIRKNCHLTVKKLPKTGHFFKKIAKNFHFFQKNCQWQFFLKIMKIFGNFF